MEADYDEAVWCEIVSGNSALTIALVYRSPNISEEDNTQIQNAMKEVSQGGCIIMGDFNHGHIQWKSLESTGGEDQEFIFLIQDSFLAYSASVRTNQGRECISNSFVITKRISGQKCMNHWVKVIIIKYILTSM